MNNVSMPDPGSRDATTMTLLLLTLEAGGSKVFAATRVTNPDIAVVVLVVGNDSIEVPLT